jgi:hypothetical protein
MIRRVAGFRKAFGHIKERWKGGFYQSVKFISTNALALTSLFIAALSLYLTVHTQNEDRDYKEMMIRPALTYEVHPFDLTVGYRNDGLGPAVIVDFVYKDGDECLSVADIYNSKLISGNIYRVGLDIQDRLFTQVYTFAVPTKSPGVTVARFNERGTMLAPGSIIATGKEWSLFRVPDDTLSEFRQDLNKLQPATVSVFQAKFFEAAMTLPFSLRYCSLSGKYCYSIREDVTKCKMNDLREFPHKLD